MMNKDQLKNIPKEKFAFAQREEALHDLKLETKPIGYFRDAFNRFKRNKSSVVSAVIILLLLLYAIIVPWVSPYETTFMDGYYKSTLPKVAASASGFWDGAKKETVGENQKDYYTAMGVESGLQPVKKMYGTKLSDDRQSELYELRVDSYYKVGYVFAQLTPSEFADLQAYQNEHNVQIMFPMTDETQRPSAFTSEANYWYKTTGAKGKAVKDSNGNFIPIYLNDSGDGSVSDLDKYQSLRIEGDDGSYLYGQPTQSGYKTRVLYYRYFEYRNGFEPCFIFGTNGYGQDLFTSLANGARFSFLLAICVSLLNLIIGAIYGAIEGYYGGTLDLMMERLVEILSGIPFIILATLFQFHFANKVGVVPSLLFAFVLTGWIGTAGTVRTQFYRFKHQEYVLAARTLGARDGRLMFRHIFPNSLGTIITSSVLVIPGVIGTESMLSYLNIVNLEGSGTTSVGTLLSSGQSALSTFPHILLFPALFLSLLMICFNLFGNGLRDAFNPSLRGSGE